MSKRWRYVVRKCRVVDGDTIEATVVNRTDYGFGNILYHEHTDTFRLYGINAPETRTKNKKEKFKGFASKQWLLDRVEKALDSDTFILETIKDKQGKFGRYLAILWIDNVNINDEMIKLGYAEVYDE